MKHRPAGTAGRAIFKVLVQVRPSSISLMRYIDKNIEAVNGMGVKVIVEKITDEEFDADLVEKLKNLGITRLPALITADKKIYIGLDDILKSFKASLQNQYNNNRVAFPGDQGFGSGGGNVQSYWERELFAGKDNKGKIIPRKDGEDETSKSLGDDMARLAGRFMAARGPKGDGQANQPRAPRRKRGGREQPPDNIDSDGDADFDDLTQKSEPDDGGNSIADTYGDDMVKAWMMSDGAPNTDY